VKKIVLLGLVICLFMWRMGGIAEAVPVTWSYNGHSYEVISANSTTWAEARTQAHDKGAGWDLATITSIEEQNFITNLLGPAPGNLVEYYIGGVETSSNVYEWVTGEAFSFSFWGAGEPNNPMIEPYIALDGRHPNWGWNDYTGAGSSFILGYVAELHITNSVPEPGTILLLGSGLAGLLFRRKKKEIL